MQAIIYRRYGGPEVLELVDVEPPKLHVDSVLVRVRAAAVNPADLRMREGLVDGNVATYFPVIPGWDIAGVVEEAGPGAPEFRPGDEVVGYVRTSVSHRHGGYAELVATDVHALAPKPASLSWEQAAALPLAGLTAYQAITGVLDVQPGESLLVYGAAGGVGSMAVQIAVARGATVLGVGAGDRAELLRGLGATPVGDDEQVTERVRAIVPVGVDAVFDTVGRGMLARAAAVGHDATRYASTVDIADPGTRPVFARLVPVDLHAVTELAVQGRLLPHVGVVLPLAEAADAHRLAATRHGMGRIVLRIGA
ncbi:NADP-dependent oxidoreductase [Streptomyces sp. IB201691-2A2]|uniref:NADP-dependent oxidoreductase n=1 Tax=Streptomyces sp. IB201691-2A2 TaxID=2561920 RepID=UPI00117E1378|nr:NADP-dependent oxidoreductase [Streptomyces sp. IB201691-2A2]TRO55727.1 NADP-dependent oxidoreductase [Streptomyces sp. IB201691-2A2]